MCIQHLENFGKKKKKNKTSVLICTSRDFSPSLLPALYQGTREADQIHDQVAVDDSPAPETKEPDVLKHKRREKKKKSSSPRCLIHIFIGDASAPP